ncbi:hypothetical protein VTN77DRAFT_840 [Rasamsonia byssochlamydoides]|uniref:uncharacterized protein n=1 Tax=Rasamsonia byssochlamydoides TaxID=89139 RepID=UPI0037447BD2
MVSDKAEKKRKRNSDRHERPSKKPALEPQNLPPLAASVVEDDSELAPVLVSTPGLQFPKKLNLRPYLKSRSSGSLSSSSSGRNKGIVSTELLLQSSEHPKLDFLGREADDDADSQVKHYVAVVDPERKTWQFVEVRKMTLRGSVRRLKRDRDADSDAASEEEEEDDVATTSIRDQRNALTHAFGTKASKKAAQSIAENALLSNAPAGAANAAESAILSSIPAEAIAEASTKAATLQAEIQAAKPVPPANTSASHPSDVYPIDVLVPNGLSTLRQLPVKEWQDAVAAGNAITTTSRYVAHRVEAVVKSGNTTHLQILRFILILLEFARCLRRGKATDPPGSKRLPPREDLRRILSSSGSPSSSSSSQLPDPVIDAIRRKFAPQGGLVSRTEFTLLHTTICALSLHIPPTPARDGGSSSLGGNAPNELATDPSDLRDDLRLDNPTVTQYFRELGCRIDKPRESEFAKWGIKGGKVEAAARRIARLRVPVEFPKVSRGGGSRR